MSAVLSSRATGVGSLRRCAVRGRRLIFPLFQMIGLGRYAISARVYNRLNRIVEEV